MHFSHWQLCTIWLLVPIIRYSLWQKYLMKTDIRLKWLGQAENELAHQQNTSCALELFHSCMQISITHMRKLIHSTVNQKALKSSNTSLNHRLQLQLRWTNRKRWGGRQTKKILLFWQHLFYISSWWKVTIFRSESLNHLLNWCLQKCWFIEEANK